MEFGPVGSMIPSILELVDQYDCGFNNNMIRHAQSVLIDEGLIEPRRGQGTFIIALPPGQNNKQAAWRRQPRPPGRAGQRSGGTTKLLSQLALSVGRGLVRAATISNDPAFKDRPNNPPAFASTTVSATRRRRPQAYQRGS